LANPTDNRLELAMGQLLRAGVTMAAAVVLIGGILYLRSAPAGTPDYTQFHGAPAFESVHAIVAGALRFNPQSIIALGILLLIATPICRVLMGAIGFLAERDRLYAAISTVVLAILLISFFTAR
jgi:uncharacterized membrane protein